MNALVFPLSRRCFFFLVLLFCWLGYLFRSSEESRNEWKGVFVEGYMSDLLKLNFFWYFYVYIFIEHVRSMRWREMSKRMTDSIACS